MLHEQVTAVFRKGTSLRGRSRRAEFWRYLVVMCAANQLVLMLGDLAGVRAVELAAALLVAYLTALGVAALVRRLHDAGSSGLVALLLFVPFGVLFVLWVALRDSEPGPNKWGDNPKSGRAAPAGPTAVAAR
jgi:uncharacterized membrane protein YhaH (DUF805 family)